MSSPFVSRSLIFDLLLEADDPANEMRVRDELISNGAKVLSDTQELEAIEFEFCASRPLRRDNELRVLAAFEHFVAPLPDRSDRVAMDLSSVVWLLNDVARQSQSRIAQATFWGNACPFAVAAARFEDAGALALFLDIHRVDDSDPADPRWIHRAIEDRKARFAELLDRVPPETLAAAVPPAQLRTKDGLVLIDVLDTDGSFRWSNAANLHDRLRSMYPPW